MNTTLITIIATAVVTMSAAQAQNDVPRMSSIVSSVPFTNCPACLLRSTNNECQVIISVGQAETISESPLAAAHALDTLAQHLIPDITPDNSARLSYILLQVIQGGGGDKRFSPAAGGQRHAKAGGYDWYSVMGASGGVLFIARAKAPECRDKLTSENQAIVDEAIKQDGETP
jgi:hypothetical protein